MHEIVKYFILTEIQKQCLNPMPEPLIGPGRPAELARPAAAGPGPGAQCAAASSQCSGCPGPAAMPPPPRKGKGDAEAPLVLNAELAPPAAKDDAKALALSFCLMVVVGLGNKVRCPACIISALCRCRTPPHRIASHHTLWAWKRSGMDARTSN